MAAKKGRSKAGPKTASKATEGGTIHSSVYQNGQMYNEGDEKKLMAAGFSDEVLQHLTDRGHISGFGFEARDPEEVEAAEAKKGEEDE